MLTWVLPCEIEVAALLPAASCSRESERASVCFGNEIHEMSKGSVKLGIAWESFSFLMRG